MPVKNYKNELMVKLRPSFIQKVFIKLSLEFKGSKKASKLLQIPYSSFRAYKNRYSSSLPQRLIDKIEGLKIMSKKQIQKNKLYSYYRDTQNKKILANGRQIRLNKLKRWKNEIPRLSKIFKGDYLDFETWFIAYKKLIDFGARKFNYVRKKRGILEVSYIIHSNKEKKEFILKFPSKIIIDDEFVYFFGLWCGDRTGGKRFGICNKNADIIKFTEHFLKKYNQRVEKTLIISKGVLPPKIDYDKKFIIDHDVKGWVLSVHSTNGILSSFFHYLQSNLEEFLTRIKNKEVFFAGLFDAEGNVSLYNGSFRWACKNNGLVDIYSKFLKELDLFNRYDGGCLITYNRAGFYKKILPFLKHTDKINKTKFLCKGEGTLWQDYLKILEFIKNNPDKTAKEIAKALKKTKVYSELKLLNDFGFISRDTYPQKFEITLKGLKSLGA